MTRRPILPSALLVVAFTLASCGYHAGSRSGLLPKTVRTVAVRPFTSMAVDYKLGDMLPNALAHELTVRSRLQVVPRVDEADAVLNGTVNRVLRGPSLSDPTTGKTTSVTLVVIMSVTLTDRLSGHVLFSRPSLAVRENYELARDPHQLIDESAPALQRLSQTTARDIVSAILEDF